MSVMNKRNKFTANAIAVSWVPYSLLVILFLADCASLPEYKVVEKHCQSQLMDNEKIQCYRQAITKQVTQKIINGTRALTASDWPFKYRMRVDIRLASNGRLLETALVQPTGSKHLNTQVLKAIERVDQFSVPHNELFEAGGFDSLRLLIRPARKAILGGEKAVPSDILQIYLPGACATRNRRC